MYVVSNMALVIKALLDSMGKMIPGVHCVYDENLSYESALRRYRANQESMSKKEAFLPAFVFRRGVLQHSKYGVGKRMITDKIIGPTPVEGNTPIYKAVHGWLEIPFLVIMKDMVQLEHFEIAYLAESLGVNAEKNEKQLNVTIPGIEGQFPYYVKYTMLEDHLEDKTVNTEDNFYKTASGTVAVHGFFLLFWEQAPVIQEIKLKIQDFYSSVLVETTINH